MPVLYYLDESGPHCLFVREQLMHIKEEPMLLLGGYWKIIERIQGTPYKVSKSTTQ
jgi:hypothetical protein